MPYNEKHPFGDGSMIMAMLRESRLGHRVPHAILAGSEGNIEPWKLMVLTNIQPVFQFFHSVVEDYELDAVVFFQISRHIPFP
jgi:hypothetical protein